MALLSRSGGFPPLRRIYRLLSWRLKAPAISPVEVREAPTIPVKKVSKGFYSFLSWLKRKEGFTCSMDGRKGQGSKPRGIRTGFYKGCCKGKGRARLVTGEFAVEKEFLKRPSFEREKPKESRKKLNEDTGSIVLP